MYNTLIWTLCFGILIVIITLLLMQPEPESFTELYFLDHQLLPKYVIEGQKYNYTFVISNLENRDKEYYYNITTELYNIDYSCEKSELWLELSNDSKTYVSETDDPALLIKSEEYAINTNYDLRSGKKLIFRFKNIYGTDKYSLTIDHDKSEAELLGKTIKLNAGVKHKLQLIVNKKNMTAIIDNKTLVVETPKDYTTGFPYIESELIDYSGFTITRNQRKQTVTIRYADAKLLEPTLTLSKKSPDPTKFNKTGKSYTGNNTINMTKFTLSALVRTSGDSHATLGLSDALIIDIGKKATINNIEYNITKKATNEVIINYKDSTAEIIINEIPLINITASLEKTTPFIDVYENSAVTSLSLKAYDTPTSVTYRFPDQRAVSYSGIYTISNIEGLQKQSKDQENDTEAQAGNKTGNISTTETVKSLINRESINWTNYILRTSYLEGTKNSTFKVSFNDYNKKIYSLTLNGINDTYNITYWENNTEKRQTGTVQLYSTNRLTIEGSNGILRIQVNSQTIYEKKVQYYTGGMPLFEYPGSTMLSAQIEDRNSNKIKVFKKEITIECAPMILKTFTFRNIHSLANDRSAVFRGYVDFNDDFDIAKVQVSLDNGQEIHFWTRRI